MVEGLRAGDPQSVGPYRLLGRLGAGGMGHVFLATGLTPGTAELEVEEQDLVHRWFPRAEVEGMIRTGIITDDSSVAAYTLLLLSAVTVGEG